MEKKRDKKQIDASGQVLGRLAAEVASFLRGKEKPEFVYHINIGSDIEVYNLEKIKITGKKLEDKIYFSHTGYPGGLRELKLKDLIKKNPEAVFRKAVKGMLPKNKLSDQWLKQLKLYKGETKR